MASLLLLKRKIRAQASRKLPGSATIGRVTCFADWNPDAVNALAGVPIIYNWKVDGDYVRADEVTEEMFQS